MYVCADSDPAHDNCDVCEYLLMHAMQDVLLYVHIWVDGEIFGQVKVEILVFGLTEGGKIIVRVCRGGIVYAICAVIRDGYASFRWMVIIQNRKMDPALQPGPHIKRAETQVCVSAAHRP